MVSLGKQALRSGQSDPGKDSHTALDGIITKLLPRGYTAFLTARETPKSQTIEPVRTHVLHNCFELPQIGDRWERAGNFSARTVSLHCLPVHGAVQDTKPAIL